MERLCCWTAAGYMSVLGCVCINVVSECAQTWRLPPTSPSLACWSRGPWVLEKSRQALAAEGLLLPLALRVLLAISRMLCSVAV